MTRTDQHTESPTAPRGRRRRARSVSLRTIFGSAAIATVAGAVVLGVLTLTTDDQNEATGRQPIAEQAGSRASQGPVQDQAGPPGGRAPACWWTSEANTPVFPTADLGGPPNPESILIFERCNGEWTGNIAWSNPGDGPDAGPAASATVSAGAREHERFAKCVEGETHSRAMVSSSDDGLPNPWEAGNIAAKCYLLTDTSAAPSTSASARLTEAPASASPPTGNRPTCSIWSVPTLEVAPVPRSSLTEGVPYAAMCTEDADDEETTFVFFYGHDTPPAPRR